MLVIGAGLSGLVAARELGARGVGVRVLEARECHFAAHTALHWPSFMDGAIESGRRVAAEVHAAM